MLVRRILTAAVLVPLLVGVTLYGPGYPFLLLAGAAAVLCAVEYYRMFFFAFRDRATGTALTAAAFAAASLLPGGAAVAALALCVGLAACHFLPGESPPAEKVRSAALSALGVVYLGGLFSAWPRMIGLAAGGHWVLFGIVAVAAGDTAAYFIGRAWGKRKLAPSISPHKTVEGAAGGLAASVICAAVYAAATLPSIPVWYAAVAAAAAGIAGQAGDLFESLLKRAAGRKDSGSILPGHGGMLDRADGVIGAGPVLYLAAILSPFAGGAA